MQTSETQSFSDGQTGKVIPPKEEPQQMPLSMLGGDGDFDASLIGGDPATGKKMPGLALVVVIMLIIGGGALWAMRMTGGAAAAPDKELVTAENRIDEALKKLAAGDNAAALSTQSLETIFQDAQTVLAVFANDPVKNQVALDQLAENPFRLEEHEDAPAQVTVDNVAIARQERLRKLREELAALKLQSVLSGSRPLAIISGQTVRIGDSAGSFTVAAISGQSVVLQAEGESFELSMPLPSAGGK